MPALTDNNPTLANIKKARLREAAVEFGANLRRWRRRQGWAQDTPMDWGQAIGAPHVYSSQWSQLETASMRNPGPGIFCALGWMNQRLANQNYGPIRDRALMDRVRAAQPIRHDDGEAWDAADWFAAYVGQQPWPSDLAPPPPVISETQATTWSNTLRDWFQDSAAAADLEPMAAATGVLRHVTGSAADRQAFQRLLLGFGSYTPEQLVGQWEQEEGTPVEWIAAWRESLGLPAGNPAPPWQ